jgi:hypothetical protein
MIALDIQEAYFSPEEMEANLDAPLYPEREAWELTLSKIKEAILDRNILKARLLSYSLEREILEAKALEYRRGFQHGSLPLPF